MQSPLSRSPSTTLSSFLIPYNSLAANLTSTLYIGHPDIVYSKAVFKIGSSCVFALISFSFSSVIGQVEVMTSTWNCTSFCSFCSISRIF